jgi:hypothetical protein
MKRLNEHLTNFLSILDKFPFTPANLANKVVENNYKKKIAVSSEDPAWVELQHKNQQPGPSFEAFSQKLGDLIKQSEIEDKLSPDPFWLPLAAKIERATLANAYRKITLIIQKRAFGYNDTDLWNLDMHIAAHLSKVIKEFASKTHGYPSDYPDYETWINKLNSISKDLASYQPKYNETLQTLELKYSLSIDSKEKEEIENKIDEETALAEQRAQEALEWVSQNLTKLWD